MAAVDTVVLDKTGTLTQGEGDWGVRGMEEWERDRSGGFGRTWLVAVDTVVCCG